LRVVKGSTKHRKGPHEAAKTSRRLTGTILQETASLL